MVFHRNFRGSGGEVHHQTMLGLGLELGLGTKVRVTARVRVSKLGGELLHQRQLSICYVQFSEVRYCRLSPLT